MRRTRNAIGGAVRDRSSWLALLCLAVGILAPAACVVWFMNEAIANQADASRQRVSEAYRGQLRLLRERLDAEWQAVAASIQSAATHGPLGFHDAAAEALADVVIRFDAHGTPEYPPAALPPPAPDLLLDDPFGRSGLDLEASGRADMAGTAFAWVADHGASPAARARAAQAYIRTLVRSGTRTAALAAIDRHFGSGPLSASRDPVGRLIAADQQLLALQLLSPADSRWAERTGRLATLLNDYERVTMPASQRLFLMTQLRRLDPSASLPTYDAERIAAEFIAAGGAPAPGRELQPAGVDGVWTLTVGDGVVALFTKRTIDGIANRALASPASTASTRLTMVPPGAAATDEAVAAGRMFPGWQLSLVSSDATAAADRSRRSASAYVWAGTSAIAILAIAGLLVWQSFHRQLRLTHLRTDLVAAVSHELKTPLASMRLLVDSLLGDDELDAAKTRDYLRLMATENARLTRLIEHFLTFSRIERSNHRLAFREVQPEAVVHAAVALVRERFDTSHTDLLVAVGADLPPLRGDEDALVTVLLNLLENAHTYTGADKRIALHAFADEARVVFEVEDNGVGIAPRDQKRVFRRFYQVDQSLSRATGGCGLGLSIVEFIVKAHGGAVALRSQPGAGSTFRVSLPHSAAGGLA